MAGYRSRSRSYSPRRRYSRSPPRYKHYDDPRDRYRGGGGGGGGPRRGYDYDRPSAPTGLLVRNISLTARLEDIRGPFEQFGPIKDVYLPRNFHTNELRGFGFVKFRHPEDAAYAKQEMNHQVICGREITIVFAEENRKTPQEMRFRTRSRPMDGNFRRRQSLSRSPRSRRPSYSPGPSPVRQYSRDRNRSKYSPEGSYSPHARDKRQHRSNGRSPSPDGDQRRMSPSNNGHGPPVDRRSPT
ncbi:hypothetical protein ACQ4PT_015168 [Festuca glaucescens]